MDIKGINLSKLRENFDKADFKHGKSSYCFIIDDKIIKIYARKKDGVYPENVLDLSKYSADTIVFPEGYILENDKIVAEISRYINSKDIITSFNDDALLDVIISGYKLLVQDFELYQDLLMKDLCSANILFSNELGFHIIDTSEWKNKADSFKRNLCMLNLALISTIIESLGLPITYGYYSICNSVDETFNNNLSKYGAVGRELQECITKLINNQLSFLNLINGLKALYREYYGTEAKTLGDLKNLVGNLNKKVDLNTI